MAKGRERLLSALQTIGIRNIIKSIEEYYLVSSYAFSSQESEEKVLGANDSNLSYLEMLLGSDMTVRGNVVFSEGEGELLPSLFKRLEELARKEDEITESQIFMEYQQVLYSTRSEDVSILVREKRISAKTIRQKEYMKALEESQIVFSIGPAGTGKTFIAIAHALSELLSGRKRKVILSRPVVEAGESLGFLPGDLSQKLNPYMRPLYDAMETMLTFETLRRLEDSGAIEISPLAYMRGRSLNSAVVILDEAQNATRAQMKMFLTRLGEGSEMIVTGDPSQIDLPRKHDSGLLHAIGLLENIEGIKVVKFDSEDAVRSRIIRDIIRAYGRDEDAGRPD